MYISAGLVSPRPPSGRSARRSAAVRQRNGKRSRVCARARARACACVRACARVCDCARACAGRACVRVRQAWAEEVEGALDDRPDSLRMRGQLMSINAEGVLTVNYSERLVQVPTADV